MANKNVYGFLRENDQSAKRAGVDQKTGLCRTGLNRYLSVIYPDINDWEHDKSFGVTKSGDISRRRPDYISREKRLVIEFDGTLHYTNPLNIIKDEENNKFYENEGYKVIRIPYFIQLTKENVFILFGVEVKCDLFPENICSLNPENKNSPSFLCYEGIRRMAKEYLRFSKDYKKEIDNLESMNNDRLTGVDILKIEHDKLLE